MSAASGFTSDCLAGLRIYRLPTLANVGQFRLCDGAGTEQVPWEGQADHRLSAAVAISRHASVTAAEAPSRFLNAWRHILTWSGSKMLCGLVSQSRSTPSRSCRERAAELRGCPPLLHWQFRVCGARQR